jgi:hypothetical protein
MYNGGRSLKSYKEFSTFSVCKIEKNFLGLLQLSKLGGVSSYGRTLFFSCSCSHVLQEDKGEVTV